METLQSQFAKSRSLRRAVMRRVWYVFMVSLILRPALVLGFVFGASAIAFWRLVSITSIVENFLQVQVGHLPTYVGTALMQADTTALLAFIGLCIVAMIVCGQMLAILVATWRSRPQLI
ncbi:MAG: hypothetical protein RLZZ360_228 [Candidatus Parcubacteria bacterium]|jgi:hypothetical protein